MHVFVRMPGEAVRHKVVHLRAELGSCEIDKTAWLEDLDDVKVNVAAAAQDVLQHGARTGERADGNGNAGPLRDFKYAVAEWLELACLACGALGKNSHGSSAGAEIVHSFENGAQGGTVIFPVNGQAADGVHERRDNGQALIFLFGDKAQRGWRQDAVKNNGINGTDVVADEQIWLLRQLRKAACMDARAAVKQRQLGEARDKKTDVPVRGSIFFFSVYAQ